MKLSERYCTIYVVRHGESEWNVKGLIQGQSDSFLTQEGEKQAYQLVEDLKSIKLKAIFSSNLIRAKKLPILLLLKKI